VIALILPLRTGGVDSAPQRRDGDAVRGVACLAATNGHEFLALPMPPDATAGVGVQSTTGKSHGSAAGAPVVANHPA
jgi:hypothetical protein